MVSVRVFNGEEFIDAKAIGLDTSMPLVVFADGTTENVPSNYVEIVKD